MNSLSPAPPPRIPRYSFHWADTIVEKAQRSHSRGWNILVPILRLDRRQLAFLIACNDPDWPQIRWAARFLDRWNPDLVDGVPKPGTTKQMLSAAAPQIIKRVSERLGTYLTSRFSDPMLEEQVIRGFRYGIRAVPESTFVPYPAPDVQKEFDFG